MAVGDVRTRTQDRRCILFSVHTCNCKQGTGEWEITAQRPKTQRQPDTYMVPSRVLAHRKALQTCRIELPVPTPDPQHIYRQQPAATSCSSVLTPHRVTNNERSRPSRLPRRTSKGGRHRHLTKPPCMQWLRSPAASLLESRISSDTDRAYVAAAMQCKPGGTKRTKSCRQRRTRIAAKLRAFLHVLSTGTHKTKQKSYQ